MNTIVNKIRFALVLGFMVIGIAAWSQGVSHINKMSITTQMFLEERDGRLTFDTEIPPMRSSNPNMKPLPKPRRPYAAPDTIDGKVYIAATVRITHESDLADLESKGVIIQCKFDKGLVTTLIPVDQIEEVAALEGVTRINVSALMRPLTNLARQTTNVDDVLTLSADAQGAGLNSIYDGSGVILGVIDDGIDFQHGAFKDKNGNTRLKRAYCYNGSSATYWQGSGTLPTTDDSSEDHGTHTSTIAGGSSVIVSGTTVTVTDDHANATYGGMAPGADLFLAGTQLSTTHILNSFQYMSEYADQVGKPLVVSNSWGSSWYARDGYSDMTDVLAQYFGDSHPNRICLFASGNEAGMGLDGQGGGRYVTGTSTENSPLGTIVRSSAMLESYGYQYYSGLLANAWTRASDATGIGINIHVINKNTGALYQSYSYKSTNSNSQNSVTLAGLNYSVYVLFDYVQGQGKHQAAVYANSYKATSNYVFAIEAYPIGGSSNIIDIYGGDYTYLTNYVSTSGHTWVNGTDDQSMGDACTDPNVISVGSYVTRNGTYSTGDISDFSSYAAPGAGPTGVQYPWITAPGEVIISGYNHYVSSTNHDLVVNNSTAPYGEMSGTSMACPAAAGIVALWLQASMDNNAQHKNLTVNDVKQIMAETAIRDSWVTSGPHASHFGNGKIDALAGIQYILGLNEGRITVDPTELTFGGSDFWAGNTESKTVVVTNTTDEALHLTIAGLNASLSGTPFSVTAITNNGNVAAGGGTVTITITYAPTVPSTNDQATLTIADDVTVALTGSCVKAPEPYDASVSPAEGTLAYGTVTIGNTVTQTITITNEGLNPFTPVVDVDAPFSASYDQTPLAPGESRTITVTFTPTQEGDYSETLTITASESNDISFTYTVTGSGEAPYIAATVSPSALDFMGTTVGNTNQKSVTIANTGTMAFTPVINTDNLPATYSVTLSTPAKGTITGSEVPVGGSLEMNVTYSPTSVGTENGTITIAIGDQTYTVNVYGSGVEVTDATVCDGSDTNGTVPVYGNYYNRVQTNQMLYPASKFTSTGMNGKTIRKITFYPSNGINFRGGTVTIKLANMTSETTGYTYNNPTHKDADFVTVKTITMPNTAQATLTEWVIEDLTGDFTYNGGDLLIEITTTTGSTGATNFYGEQAAQSTYPSYYSYVRSGQTTSRGVRFLPKVKFEWDSEPYVAGMVSATELTFTDVPLNRSEELTVTIENTGTMNFTPVIDTSNLPSEFEVTGNGEVLPNGTLDLTVTYTPTDEGPHSGSFTVTIGDQVFTVNVTGNGIVINNTLTSNTVMVPVYKTDIEVLTVYTIEQLENDINHSLPENLTNADVNVKVKRDDAITRYDVYHKDGVKTSEENWATGELNKTVAYTAHNAANYIPYAKDQENMTSWVQQPTVTFADGENEMWVHLNDYVEVQNADTWYVPVVVADGIVTTGNTYGAPIRPSYSSTMTATVNYDQSTIRTDANNNNAQYYYMTAEVAMHCVAPQVEDGADYHYECFLARAWRQWTPYVVGVGAGERTETLMGEVQLSGSTDDAIIGCKDFQMVNGQWSTDEPVFCSPAESTPLFISRFYYKRVANDPSLKAGGGGGGGGGGAGAPGEGPVPPQNPTGVNEFNVDKTSVSVTYVNTLGMTSSQPFDGVNIVITRYSDGSTSTTKILR